MLSLQCAHGTGNERGGHGNDKGDVSKAGAESSASKGDGMGNELLGKQTA